MTEGRVAAFRRWFWRPPRAHGEVIHDRTVGFLELYYDLVYVAVIIQLAHRLAHELTVAGLIQYAIVFTLIFIAWVNGSLYLELHGGDDGRTRTIVFIQIALLALLAVFIGDAATTTSVQFTLAYGAFLAVMTWLWHDGRSQDRRDRPESVQLLGGYGFSREYPVERVYRDIRGLCIGAGTVEIQRNFIGTSVLKGGTPASDGWKHRR